MIYGIIGIDSDDGVMFNQESLYIERITEGAEYQGVRVKFEARLTNARKVMQLDIGFGDVIVAGPVEMAFPVLLDDQQAPNLWVYSRESVIAEKFEALVSLNILTSRMKDIFDILFLAERETFSFSTLQQAMMATFSRRVTQLENRHVLFSQEFSSNRDKETQWNAFLRRNRLQFDRSLPEAMIRLKSFLEPVCSLTEKETSMWFPSDWNWR